MWRAIVRGVSPSMDRCELTYLDRGEIDLARAVEQHATYVRCLREFGMTMIELPADPALPDCVFVEDPVVVVDEVAVVARMGAESRRAESQAMATAIAPYRELRWMEAPATLDGGDVFRVGRTLFAGLSKRTNEAGIGQLAAAVESFGYEVRPVEVGECLHLKSGACWVGGRTLLVNRDWIDVEPFTGYELIDVEEPWAADVLPIGDVVLMPDGFPKTRARLKRAGYSVRTIDVSELQKAESGVTCMSVIFDDPQ
jgi:dimethylargininase